MRNIVPLIILVVGIALALFLIQPDFSSFLSGTETPSTERTVSPFFTKLPEGRQEYQISSAEEARPRFLSAVIDPLKVQLGDRQFMQVVVEDEAEVVSVVAEIQTDNETQNIPLELKDVSALSREEKMNQRYLVVGGELVINDGSSNDRWSLDDLKLAAPTAEAQSLKKFTFEGEWVVRDTSAKEYRTKFIARDELGRENSITMAWLDPCDIVHNTTSTLTANCSIAADDTTGIDGGNFDLGGFNLTLNSGSIFAWNPGQKIIISGSISISGGQLQKKYLCAPDSDQDSYYDGDNITLSDSATCASGTRLKDSPGGEEDCFSELPTSTTRAHLVNPGQTSYFTVSSTYSIPFDYSCNGTEEKNDDLRNDVASCEPETGCSQ